MDLANFTLDDFAFPIVAEDTDYFVVDDFAFLTGIAPPPPTTLGIVYDGGRDREREQRWRKEREEKKRKKLRRQKEMDVLLALEYLRMGDEL